MLEQSILSPVLVFVMLVFLLLPLLQWLVLQELMQEMIHHQVQVLVTTVGQATIARLLLLHWINSQPDVLKALISHIQACLSSAIARLAQLEPCALTKPIEMLILDSFAKADTDVQRKQHHLDNTHVQLESTPMQLHSWLIFQHARLVQMDTCVLKQRICFIIQWLFVLQAHIASLACKLIVQLAITLSLLEEPH